MRVMLHGGQDGTAPVEHQALSAGAWLLYLPVMAKVTIYHNPN
jgi:hypothetical protein